MTLELLARLIGVQHNAISIVARALRQAGVISYSRGTRPHHECSGAADHRVRMLSHRQGKTRAMAQGRAVTFDDAIHTIEPCDCDEICTLAPICQDCRRIHTAHAADD